jgi:hypothetical protein
LAALRSITDTAETIINSAKTNGKKIQREARRMAEQVILSINLMRGMVGLAPDDTLSKGLAEIEDEAA